MRTNVYCILVVNTNGSITENVLRLFGWGVECVLEVRRGYTSLVVIFLVLHTPQEPHLRPRVSRCEAPPFFRAPSLTKPRVLSSWRLIWPSLCPFRGSREPPSCFRPLVSAPPHVRACALLARRPLAANLYTSLSYGQY